MTIAGIIAKPIATTKAMITPLALAARCLNFSVTGYDSVVTLNIRFGFPRAFCSIA